MVWIFDDFLHFGKGFIFWLISFLNAIIVISCKSVEEIHEGNTITIDTQESKHLTKALADTIGGWFAVNKFVKICDENGIIYFSAPFASAERTTLSFSIAIASLAGKTVDLSNENTLNSQVGNTMVSPKQFGMTDFGQTLDDPGFFKLAFVRDPVARFCETFSAMLTNESGQSSARNRIYEKLEIDLTYDLKIEELASILAEDEEILNLVPMVRPQSRMIAYDIVEYGFIGRHENWAADFAKVSEEIFGAPVDAFDPVEMFGKPSENVVPEIEISAQTRRYLEIAFAADYEMLEEIDQSTA